MPEIEVRWDNPEPHSVQIEVSSEMLMGLFTGVGECKTKIEGLEQRHVDSMEALTRRIDTLWRVIIACFIGSVSILGTLMALFNGAF